CVDYVRARSLHYFYFHRSSTTQIYTLSLHDALPIYQSHIPESNRGAFGFHTEIALSLGRLAAAVDELTVDGQFDRAVNANHIIRIPLTASLAAVFNGFAPRSTGIIRDSLDTADAKEFAVHIGNGRGLAITF